MNVIISEGNAYDSEAITVSTTAIGFAAAKIKSESNGTIHPISAVFSTEDADIRISTDGTDPTASVGLLIETGTIVAIKGESDIRNFKAIRDAGTDAVINVTYFKD
jgi:hypothetical protein